MITSADRCRNCGLLHKTQTCPSHGPMFPAPGRTKEDYAALHEKIQNQLAADILREHGGHDHDEDDLPPGVSPMKWGPPKARQRVAESSQMEQTVPCTTCGAQVGETCTSKRQQSCRSHLARIRAVQPQPEEAAA